jgi:perosamine synthetase
MIRLTKPESAGAIADIRSVLDSGLLVQGGHVDRFETMVASYVGRKHAIAVNSGTSAIHCGLQALGIGVGDEVVVPDFTFPASANAVVTAGARPVLVDIDPSTFNIGVGSIEGSLTPQTKAVMPVDLFGLPADMETIAGICRQAGLKLIEDSACALGASQAGRMCGSFGDIGIISFHPRKIVTTAEGGMILTDSDEIAAKARSLRNHGIAYCGGRHEFVFAGYNMRMNEIEACLGIDQMARIKDLVAARRQAASLYNQLLSDLDEITIPAEPEGMVNTYQSYVIMVDRAVDRDLLIHRMRDRGVETNIGTYAVHVQPFYQNLLAHSPGSFPNSYRAFRQSLSLPIYASMEDRTVRRVVSTLKDCITGLVAGK